MKRAPDTSDYSVEYSNPLRTAMTHLKSGAEVVTDAPLDNRGLGQAFSPTDLVSAALASCILTIMGIRIEDEDWPVTAMRADVSKTMASGPRRIERIQIVVHVETSEDLGAARKSQLERLAKGCPVGHSLSADVDQDVTFYWTNKNETK
jgi:uncharacterized OsmC-like protein